MNRKLIFFVLLSTIGCFFVPLSASTSEDEFGGSSYEFTTDFRFPTTQELLRSPQHQGSNSSFLGANIPWSDEELIEFLQSFEPTFQYLKDILLRIKNDYFPTILSYRMKTLDSLKEKIVRKNYTSLDQVEDVLGFRFTAQDVPTVLQLKDTLNSSTSFFVKEISCYGVCPNPGPCPPFVDGACPPYRPNSCYRRIHLVVRAYQKPAEIQLSTPYMDDWGDWTHDIIYKGSEEIKQNPFVQRYVCAQQEYFLQLDTDRSQKPGCKCPAALEQMNVLELLQKDMGLEEGYQLWKNLGQPPNGCFWFNDLKVNPTVFGNQDPRTYQPSFPGNIFQGQIEAILTSAFVDSASSCQYYCQNFDACQAWNFEVGSKTNQYLCTLLSSVTKSIDAPTTSICGLTIHLENTCLLVSGANYFGGDQLRSSAPSIEECSSLCLNTRGCIGLSYYAPLGSCFLKNNTGTLVNKQAGYSMGICMTV